jgi:putrescine aminotransferase
MALAKSLGGGVMPIGAFMATDDVWTRGFGGSERSALHTSTFGGNVRACAAALKTIEVLVRDRLAAQAEKRGERLLAGLREAAADCQAVADVRGRGLMVGVELAESRVARGLSHEFFAAEVAGCMFRDHHVITAYTLNNPTVIRFEPPLVVTDQQIEMAVDAFRATLRTHGSFVRASLRTGAEVVGRKLGFGRKPA